MATTITSVSPSLLQTMNPQPTSTTAAATDPATALQNRFMTMLLTQMKNQNPLNPMDNSQVTSQMAQLSTVSGIGQMNTTLSSLMSSLQSSQSMQAANLIGKSVVVPGNAITLSSGTGQFGVNLTDAASNVQAVIKDASGNVVDTMNLGSLPSGPSAINWNGQTASGATAPDGQYTFSVTAANGKATVAATALSVGLVSSVSNSASAGTQLNIANVGKANYSDVLQIL